MIEFTRRLPARQTVVSVNNALIAISKLPVVIVAIA
jgi:hypothetical protein